MSGCGHKSSRRNALGELGTFNPLGTVSTLTSMGQWKHAPDPTQTVQWGLELKEVGAIPAVMGALGVSECPSGYSFLEDSNGGKCQPCDKHTYRTRGSTDTECRDCPLNSETKAEASVSAADCKCIAGRYFTPCSEADDLACWYYSNGADFMCSKCEDSWSCPRLREMTYLTFNCKPAAVCIDSLHIND